MAYPMGPEAQPVTVAAEERVSTGEQVSTEPPGLDDLLGTMRVVAIPLRVPFRGIDVREVALIRGPAGWGEFGPFPEYQPVEAARWLASAIESAYTPWPMPVRHTIKVNATVPAVTAEQVPQVLARFDGCTTAKVKVAAPGQDLRADIDRVAAVRATLGPHAQVRVDANGSWSLAQARQALTRLAAYDLEYAEQPCGTVEELAELRMALARDRIEVPIAADESIRRARDPLRVRDLAAADIVVVKVSPLGGVRAALDVVAQCGLPAVVSSALDTSVGIAAGVALAAALPSLEHACGLATVGLFEHDVTLRPLRPVGGMLRVGRVSPDEALLERCAPAPERVAWWRRRVASCHALLRRSAGELPG